MVLVQECAQSGDLHKVRVKQGGRLPASLVTMVLPQVLRSLLYLHTLGYVHRDMKAENVFMTDRCVAWRSVAAAGQCLHLLHFPSLLACFQWWHTIRYDAMPWSPRVCVRASMHA